MQNIIRFLWFKSTGSKAFNKIQEKHNSRYYFTKNRIDKRLQSSGVRLSAFVSDVFGASGRNIIRHLFTHGSITKEELDKCLRTKTRAKIDQVLVAVNGSLSKHQQDFLRLMFEHLEQIEAHKKVIEASIDNEIATHSEALALLCSIPGIDVTAASAIIAEFGTNMEFFPKALSLAYMNRL